MGLIVLDAGPIIGVLNADDAHHEASRRAVKVVPASVYAEILGDPFRTGPQAVEEVDDYLAALPARIEPISPGRRPARGSDSRPEPAAAASP